MTQPDRKFVVTEHNSKNETDPVAPTLNTAETFYEIKVKGQLDSSWSDWFDGLAVSPYEDGYTILSGPVPDQAALHGILARIRDLGLPLLSLNAFLSLMNGKTAPDHKL
jgi:hypothetical protein